jgi:hypothetical protein
MQARAESSAGMGHPCQHHLLDLDYLLEQRHRFFGLPIRVICQCKRVLRVQPRWVILDQHRLLDLDYLLEQRHRFFSLAIRLICRCKRVLRVQPRWVILNQRRLLNLTTYSSSITASLTCPFDTYANASAR